MTVSRTPSCPACFADLDAGAPSQFDASVQVCDDCADREAYIGACDGTLSGPGVTADAQVPPRTVRALFVPADLAYPIRVVHVRTDDDNYRTLVGPDCRWLEWTPLVNANGHQYAERVGVWSDQDAIEEGREPNPRATRLAALERDVLHGDVLFDAADAVGGQANLPSWLLEEFTATLRGSFGPTYGNVLRHVAAAGLQDDF